MDAVVSALWSLQFWFTFALGATFGLVLGSLLAMGRRNTEDSDPAEFLGDVPRVDVGDFLRRYK